jgi:hypothetical protein
LDNHPLQLTSFHGIAGVSNNRSGFLRLEVFFGGEYAAAYALLDETFTKSQMIGVMTSDPPEGLKEIQARDAKIGMVIRRGGTRDIPLDIFHKAYFSNNLDDVKALADAIAASFSPDELWSDLQSIRDVRSLDVVKYDFNDSARARTLRKERRLDNIDAYFRYRYVGNERLQDELLEQALRTVLKKQPPDVLERMCSGDAGNPAALGTDDGPD